MQKIPIDIHFYWSKLNSCFITISYNDLQLCLVYRKPTNGHMHSDQTGYGYILQNKTYIFLFWQQAVDCDLPMKRAESF